MNKNIALPRHYNTMKYCKAGKESPNETRSSQRVRGTPTAQRTSPRGAEPIPPWTENPGLLGSLNALLLLI